MPSRVRVLVLCAEVGEGHVTIARTLAEDLAGHEQVAAVQLRSELEVMGPRLGRFLERGFETHLEQIGWTYELAYRVFFERSLPRRAGHLALAALGGRGLKRTISSFKPHVVVTEYPVLSAALGQLRALRRLSTPVCSSISDPAGLYYWAHPGIDLHLLSWPESRREVERIAGRGRAAAIRPLIDPRFFLMGAAQRASARAAWLLPGEATVIAVSGGGWGMGDLEGAAEAILATRRNALVLCLAGRSERVHARLGSRFAGNERVRVLGFTAQMPELLCACDAIVHTTGGTTALEARVVGCRVINYGQGVAHVRAHARAMAQWGLAEWAPDRHALPAALERSLAREAPPRLEAAALPTAAELVIALARGEPLRGAGESLGGGPRGEAQLRPGLF